MKKKLPIGISDFKKVIEGNCYYFDKTELIGGVMKEAREVKLWLSFWRYKSLQFVVNCQFFKSWQIKDVLGKYKWKRFDKAIFKKIKK